MSKRPPWFRRHLPCPSCEYDLFGALVDTAYSPCFVQGPEVVRCPECGEEVDVSTALGHLRAKRVRAAVVLLGSCMALFAPAATLGLVFFVDRRFWELAAALLFVPLWLTLLCVYVHRYREVDYAITVLIMFHLCVVNAIACLGALGFVIQGGPFLLGMGILMSAGWGAWHLFWKACELIEDGHDLHVRKGRGD